MLGLLETSCINRQANSKEYLRKAANPVLVEVADPAMPFYLPISYILSIGLANGFVPLSPPNTYAYLRDDYIENHDAVSARE